MWRPVKTSDECGVHGDSIPQATGIRIAELSPELFSADRVLFRVFPGCFRFVKKNGGAKYHSFSKNKVFALLQFEEVSIL